MNPRYHSHVFDPTQVILIVGGTVLFISVLILAVYLLRKSLSGDLKSEVTKPQRLKLEDESAFTLATIKGVITQLKSEQKVLQEKLLAAERRADENARKFDLLTRELDFGYMIFDAQGFLSFANPLVRKMLAVDTWSRRRHAEIFGHLPEFAKIIGECASHGTEVRNFALEVRGADEKNRRFEVSVLPTRDRSGQMESVTCLFREATARPTDA